MVEDAIHVLAGDCTIVDDGEERAEYRGRVTVLVKPDNTVLVHDVEGYQPVAWLTRAESVSTGRGGDFAVVARDGDRALRVAAHDRDLDARYAATRAGEPVGECPGCGGALVRSRGLHCVGCGDRYPLPNDADVGTDRCGCGLPRMRVDRGLTFDVCVDRACESLDEAVRRAFDREWDCPACDGDLRILRRGGLLAGCERYPDCEVGFVFPVGVLDGECPCGLPAFDGRSGRRCLDASCEEMAAASVT